MQREPILKAATVVAFIAAVIGVFVAFGVPLTDAQRDAIMQLAIILSPGLAALATWAFSRAYTTTLSDPRDDEGVELQRVDGLPPVRK